jgi:glycosyltransferase involved in cell wall biosynthesis
MRSDWSTSVTRVVQIVPTLRDGGAEALMRSLVPRLAQEPDLDVHVVSIYDPRLDDHERLALGAPLHVIGRRGRGDLSFGPRLVSTLRRLRPAVTHAHIHAGKFAGRMASIVAGVPKIVFTEHGDEARGIVHWSVNRALNARTDRFIVFTEDERRRYAAAQGIPLSRIAVIGNGIPAPAPVDVDAIRREFGLQAGDFAIVTAARLVHQKNQELVLRAVAALHASGRRNVRALIIGEGPDGPALRAIAAELGLGDAVRFLGYRHDAQRLTAACDVMALTSRWEKMPLILGEAMLAGVPVVSTPWTGVEAFINDGQTGYLPADWSVAAFATALARSIDDPVARRNIAARGKTAAAERFDLTRAVRSHADLYRELASRTSGARRLGGREIVPES